MSEPAPLDSNPDTQEYRALFESLFDSSRSALCVATGAGVITKVNPPFGRLAARNGVAPVGVRLQELPLWDGKALHELSACLEAWTALEGLESTVIAPDGSQHFVLISCRPVGPPKTRVIVTLDDLTGERRAQTEIDRLFALVPDPLCISDLDGHLIRANPAFSELLGYADGELVGSQLLDLLHPDDRVQSTEGLGTLATGERRLGVVNRYRHRGGHYVSLSWVAIPAPDEGRIYSSARDLTELFAAQDALRTAAGDAERANLAKTEFLSRMSHELRTPLHVILGFSELLQLEGLEGEQAESVEFIAKGGRHLLELIDEILDISRVEAGTMRLSIEPVDISKVVHDAAGLIMPLALERQIHVDIQVQPLVVLADHQRFRQVLLNLLSNGIKYNRQGGSLRVRAAATVEAVRLTVTDSGPGIAAEYLDRVFAPFERLGAERTGVAGTGLGLSLCKSLVTAMAGDIGLESVPGHGSTFWVELPRAFATGAAPSPGTPFEPSAPVSDEHGDDYVVLYIEDNLANIRLVERVLGRRPNVRLISAMQGSLGLELAALHRPDLVLLDLHLPDMSGEDVLSQLKAEPATRGIPVAIASADATPGQVERLMAAGAVEYLTKPLSPSGLLNLLDRIRVR